jgi:DNA-binding GntR family transcriptional regulator
MEAAYAESGYDASVRLFDELNTEFHLVIARAAGSTRLVNVLENSLEIPASHLTPYAEPHSARIERTFWQHREIIAALKARNAEWASLQMAAHLISLVIVDPH